MWDQPQSDADSANFQSHWDKSDWGVAMDLESRPCLFLKVPKSSFYLEVVKYFHSKKHWSLLKYTFEEWTFAVMQFTDRSQSKSQLLLPSCSVPFARLPARHPVVSWNTPRASHVDAAEKLAHPDPRTLYRANTSRLSPCCTQKLSARTAADHCICLH